MKVEYDEKHNMILIPTDWLIPNLNGMTLRDRSKKLKEVFAMTYEDRIEQYATDDQKIIIQSVKDQYPDGNFCEYCGI